MRFGASAVVALVVAASLACDEQTTGGGVPTVTTVTVADNNFSPGGATVAVGDTVRWIWGDQIRTT